MYPYSSMEVVALLTEIDGPQKEFLDRKELNR